MRGKVAEIGENGAEAGITPAYAGKSIADFILSAGNWDHPRLCGEKRKSRRLQRQNVGITPAYAGKSRRLDR